MDVKELFAIPLVIFLQMFAVVTEQECEGVEGRSCCQGFRFDNITKRCIPCDEGLMGINCDTKCPFPLYGQDCQFFCNCDVTNCNHVNGCIESSEEHTINFTSHLDNLTLTTDFGISNTKTDTAVNSCKGLNGTSCCSGYMLDQEQSLCIPCGKGYHGMNCDFKCPYPYFGLGCQSLCNCSKKDCDFVNGCTQSTEEQPNSTSKINFVSTEDDGNKFHNNEKPNTCSTVMKDGTKMMDTDLTTKDARPGFINAIIGLLVAALLITSIYIYTYLLEKRKRPAYTV